MTEDNKNNTQTKCRPSHFTPHMSKPSPSGRAIQTLIPIVLACLVISSTLKIIVESSHCSNGRSWLYSIHQLLQSILMVSPPENEKLYDPLIEGCNLFEGKWTLDSTGSYPLYDESTCPYLTPPVTCLTNGRPDSDYQKWRWTPHGCQLPRFDALRLLERLRNKRLMFVGDSLQRTQWESMVCLVQSVISDDDKFFYKVPPRKIFVAKKFNATVEFYWAPFLVESNADHATKHRVQKRLVRLDSITKHSQHWEGVDVLVFDSYIWWMNKPLINASIGSEEIREYNVPTAYHLALQTWANWLKSAIDNKTQQVYFMTMSPTHLWSYEWSSESRGNCFNESEPIMKDSHWGGGSSLDVMEVITRTLQENDLNNVLHVLNITQLSEFRKDGHTSVFGEQRGHLLTSEQRAKPNIFADCIHWCLPGVPDTWNEILYAYLLHRT